MSEKLWSQLSRLREISEALQNRKPLDDNDTQYLALALRKVFEGGDANSAFDVKGGKGQSRSIKERKASDNKAMALGWVAETMCLGVSEADACLAAEEHFGVNSEALQTYRGSKKSNRDPHFKLALSRKLKC